MAGQFGPVTGGDGIGDTGDYSGNLAALLFRWCGFGIVVGIVIVVIIVGVFVRVITYWCERILNLIRMFRIFRCIVDERYPLSGF